MKTKTTKPIRPGKNLADLRKLLNAYHNFLSQFEIVFHCDWDRQGTGCRAQTRKGE